ncbi:ROK family protein [Ornithinimicrobium cavernae]|uniref:ROK family protein n=1 Tax=Ornithinimicrobium cavernae TaxID=2666047 RepID=UPI00137A68F0|nr:ROK family protein [Ornithinimicrobium cavernae]
MSLRVGVDIGGTWVDAAAVEVVAGGHRVVARQSVRSIRGPAGVLGGLRTAYGLLLEELGTGARVAALGIGVPGIVSGGRVTHAVNLGLDGRPLDLAAEAAALTSAPVLVENDVKAAAWGAAHWLRSSGDGHGQDLALLNVGTGLAAGLVLDGVLRRGDRGLAGEIGHLVTDRSGPPCPCGKQGCLELYASGGGLARRWAGSAAELMAAAAAGDPTATGVRDDLVAGLAQAVRILVQTTDVADVVLAGGVVTSTPALQEALLAALRDHGDSGFEQTLAVDERVRWLPEDYPAGSVGAALLPQPQEPVTPTTSPRTGVGTGRPGG